jgi:hypothetical protein
MINTLRHTAPVGNKKLPASAIAKPTAVKASDNPSTNVSA